MAGPASWENDNNWEPSGVPNGPNDVAIFEDLGAFGSPVTIDQDGSLGPITAKLQYDNAFVTHTNTGGNPHILDDGLSRPHISVIDGDVLFEQGLNLQTDTLIRLGSNQPLGGFSRLTFMQPIETNNNDITIGVQPNITGLVSINQDVTDPNNTSQLKVRNAIVEVNLTLTVEVAEVSGGEILVPNAGSQLKVPALTLQRGGGFTLGDSTDPLPDLTQDVQMSAGAFNNAGAQVANVPQGATLMSGHNTFVAGSGANSGISFGGPATKIAAAIAAATANFQASNPATQVFSFTDVPDRVGGDVIPYATYNNNDYAKFDVNTNQIILNDNYVLDINAAGQTDPVQVTGTQMLTADRQAAVVKLGTSAAVDLNGHTQTTHALLATDFANEVNNGVIVPVPGPDGVLYIHVPLGNDNLTLNNVDIANNGATPAKLVVAGNGSVTINSALSKTGDTHINAGAALRLIGPNGDPGGSTIFLGDGSGFPASLVLQDTSLTQTIVATPSTFDPFPTDGIVANGASTISGNISVLSDKEAPRTFGINVPNVGDSLTITGNTGPDDPDSDAFNVKIQGSGTVHLAEGTTHTVPGTIVVESATLRNNAEMIRSGFSTAQTGGLSDTFLQIFAASALSGSGRVDTSVVGLGAAVAVFFGAIEPGDSIGTLTFVGGGVAFLGTEGPATYRAELTDTGQADRLDIDGGLDLSGTNDFLELDFFSGSTLNGTYILANYDQIAGVFDNVTFLGNPIPDPTAPGAFAGTHQLIYGPNFLLLSTGPLIGDLNGDGFVGIADLNLVLGNWNQTVTPGDPLLGDPSGDGFVGIEDLNVVLGNWNAGTPPGDAPANIPEPGALVMLMGAALGVLRRRGSVGRGA